MLSSQLQRSSSQDGQKKLQISVTKTAFWVDFSDQGCAFLSQTQIFFEINQESKPEIRLWVGRRRKKKPTGMAKASNNKQKCRKHIHKEESRGEERENGRVARGAHLHPLHFHSSSTPHPFCEHFVDQFCCFIHLFACLLMPRGEKRPNLCVV